MFPTTPELVRALTTDRYREVARRHLIASAANAGTRARRNPTEWIDTLFRHRHTASNRAHAVFK